MNAREQRGLLARGMLIAAGAKEVFITTKTYDYIDELKTRWEDLAPDIREFWMKTGHWIAITTTTPQWVNVETGQNEDLNEHMNIDHTKP